MLPQTLTLALILFAGFLVKVPVLSHPLIGHFSSYQTVNAMMADMMVQDLPRSLLIPRTYLMVNGAPGLHLLYYPFASLFAQIPRLILGGGLDFWGRFQAAFFMMLATIMVYRIAKKYFDSNTALTACFLFAFSPMGLVSGISFQNEAIGLFFLVSSILLFLELPAAFLWVSGIVFSLSLVARLHFILIAPVFLVMAFSDKERLKDLFLFVLGALIPLGAWYGWAYYLQTKEPLHVMTSLFMQAGDGRILMTDLFKNVDYYKRIIEILAELWLTPVLFGFIVLGLLRWDRQRLPFIFWLFGSLLTFILLPQKAFDHPFYLISGLPAASILAAAVLSEISNRFSLGAKISFCAVFFVFSMRYFVPPAFSGGADNQKIPAMGNYLESMTGPHDLLIAQYGSAPDLLYYSGRKGWPFDLGMKENVFRDPPKIPGFTAAEGYGDPVQWLEKLRSFGARYLVISQPDKLEVQKNFSDYIFGAYEVVPVPGNSFLIFDLQKARS